MYADVVNVVCATPRGLPAGLTASEIRHFARECNVPPRQTEVHLAGELPLFVLGVRVVVIPEDWGERLDTGKGLT